MSKSKRTSKATLNLLPVMNLVTILIPMLLSAVHFSELAIIDTTLPGIVTDSVPTPDPDAVSLSVTIDRRGLEVFGSNTGVAVLDGGRLSLPCLNADCHGSGAYDLGSLERILAEVKSLAPGHRSLVLIPGDGITYERIIEVMDVAKGGVDHKLFPDISIAASSNHG